MESILFPLFKSFYSKMKAERMFILEMVSSGVCPFLDMESGAVGAAGAPGRRKGGQDIGVLWLRFLFWEYCSIH